jgi:hypothetical protein
LSSGLLRRVVWAIALMMEAASTSETWMKFYQTTWRNSPEDGHLHTVWVTEQSIAFKFNFTYVLYVHPITF